MTITVEGTAASAGNNVTVDHRRGTEPATVRSVLEDAVAVWSPEWGCVRAASNVDALRAELKAKNRDDSGLLPSLDLDHIPHWCTYFGPDRVPSLDLAGLEGRGDVTVRRLHRGVELLLGEEWSSGEALRALQHEVEPLVSGGSGTGPRPRRVFKRR